MQCYVYCSRGVLITFSSTQYRREAKKIKTREGYNGIFYLFYYLQQDFMLDIRELESLEVKKHPRFSKTLLT